jgi:hypothetical protein
MQLNLFENESVDAVERPTRASVNRLEPEDLRFHNWYRFVLSFPAHLVRRYLREFELGPDSVVLDPFSGTGTTVLEAKLNGIPSVGVEANPMAHFASSVKIDWSVAPDALVRHARALATQARDKADKLRKDGLKTLPLEQDQLLLKNSISPLPLHKALVLLEHIQADAAGAPFRNHEMLALAKILVYSISNLHFGPEVGVKREKVEDAPVAESWLREIEAMAADLKSARNPQAPAVVHRADARQLARLLPPQSVSAVFTSPPYPNEKDYTRTTRLESVILGFIKNKSELRELKQGLLRSNTRNVYKGDRDDEHVQENEAIQRIAQEIESRRVALGKTSGFEKLYGKVTKLYFGGMARHLSELRPLLKPGAILGYVVGDQASYLRVMIRTGQLLAEIACALGYRLVRIDLFRTRMATATKEQLREEVVVLQWPGFSRS